MPEGKLKKEQEILPEGYRWTELGALPKEWKVVKLGYVFEEVNKKDREVCVEDEKVYSLITVRLYAKGLVLRERKKGRKIGTKKLYQVYSGDFVFSKIDARNGAWGFVPEELDKAFVSCDFPILKLNLLLANKEFISYYLSQSKIWNFLKNLAVGTTNRKRIQAKELLRSIIIPLPPLPEQKAIATVLKSIQEAKEKTEEVIKSLREFKKSLMNYLFTYGPVPFNEKDKVELQETDIGLIPKHWKVVRLGEIFEIQQGKSLSRKRNKKGRFRPFLRTRNILWGKIDLSSLDFMYFSPEEEKKYSLKYGDILVCEGGEIGRCAVWENKIEGIYYQNHLHRLRRKREGIEPFFFVYWLQIAFIVRKVYTGVANTTTIPNLSKTRLSSFLVPLPPLPEQEKIAQILKSIDDRIQAEEEKKKALEELFKTMLSDLMTARFRLPKEFIEKFKDRE